VSASKTGCVVQRVLVPDGIARWALEIVAVTRGSRCLAVSRLREFDLCVLHLVRAQLERRRLATAGRAQRRRAISGTEPINYSGRRRGTGRWGKHSARSERRSRAR
jgi:hypothetical protein